VESLEKKEENNKENNKQDFMITGYVPFCKEGCIGITKTGYNVKNTIYYNGMRIIAVDPNIIPLYSIVNIDYNGKIIKAIALDTGGGIKGRHFDLLFKYRQDAVEFGVKHLKIEVIRWGKK